jgi:hypothetical protein
MVLSMNLPVTDAPLVAAGAFVTAADWLWEASCCLSQAYPCMHCSQSTAAGTAADNPLPLLLSCNAPACSC